MVEKVELWIPLYIEKLKMQEHKCKIISQSNIDV